MKWETNVSNINKNKIEVPNKGGVYVFLSVRIIKVFGFMPCLKTVSIFQ